MGGTEDELKLSRTLLELNEGAFARGRYEAAYNLLMAALHAAEDQSEADQLDVIATLATSQQTRLDAIAPDHRLATAQAHGPHGVFSVASQHAGMRAHLIRRMPD
jgi:hypothetical protein